MEIAGKSLKVEFHQNFYSSPNVNESFSHEFQNWGLWEHDVFEVFLTKNDSGLPYLEMQVSPLNQKFALIVKRPREETEYPKVCPFRSHAEIKDGEWHSWIEVDLDQIPGDSNVIKGNVHAIIGDTRSFFSYNVNSEDEPDFHKPELFKELIKARS